MTYKIRPRLVGNQVRVTLVGVGGTGSEVLRGLTFLNMSLLAMDHPGLDVTVVDDDTVSNANIGRQNFFPSDVGLSKAVVLVNRINMAYGNRWKAIVKRIGAARYERDMPDIVIGCVDNRQARADILNLYKGCLYMDFGNRKYDGQVVLGEIPHTKTEPHLPHVGDLFPEIIDPSLESPDDGPSCSLAEALEKQSLFINKTIADCGLNILSTLFGFGEIEFHGGFVNLKSGRSMPLAVDPEVWKRFGFKVRKPRSKKQ